MFSFKKYIHESILTALMKGLSTATNLLSRTVTKHSCVISLCEGSGYRVFVIVTLSFDGWHFYLNFLTHWGLGKMAAINQATFSNAFSWMKMYKFQSISLSFVPKGPLNNIPALVQITAWCHPGDRPLSEPMVVSLLTHICVGLNELTII